MYFPDVDTFRALGARGNLIPVCREIMADMDTPVSAFRKLDDGRYAFLLESIEGGEKWARYTFLGASPSTVIRSRGTTVEIITNGETRSVTTDDPLGFVRDFLARFRPVEIPGLPRFFGGAVGYLGYDMVRQFERLPTDKPAVIGAWDSCFLITDTIVIFDNMRQKITVVSNAHLDEGVSVEAAYADAVARIDGIIARLKAPLPAQPAAAAARKVSFSSNITREAFEDAVERAKEYVRAGDIIQVVLSQRFSGELTVDPLDIYRVLRTLNPSPYMFFLRLDDTLVVGASPEVMVRREGNRVELRPIAGTRPRGATPEQDEQLAEELLADPKERAEHVMLVDLGRNDLGRVCRTGTVKVSELMVIERYSHVMHIVSNVQGELAEGRDAFDVVRATFPAGTLSGAPKVRAMEIIDELEPVRREVYGGAVGYFSFSGTMDLAIAIRTLVIRDGVVHLQAGAGIVADSDPASEYQETVNKAMAVVKAIETAEKGLD
ncbi:anthranilate synthase component I [Geobacter sulfurreducens]|uniref:Anthranilate synthase component 1 n=1 Tax=Geobacter sulfurreducens (strain ATCC 51573 / DSM 12127 / PCA) TaxID=243231 RepID=Q74AH2_GEOSL|nr:anthranilate synthase component I [Geobacter sulfurreducens]AAR35756.1 anthranilate synthase, catalytic subunit [Geobacter sulfurreducens PCA]ADI85137.1 anthranilate synthase, catalytic subunit [Geobacter sulfurreducens KN400]UAC03086.1 anthranilate synthase component I [Geobacter sulfurreducens]HCD94809.1 anthranilate synthase component I [Geobacter sulfurreducens]